MASPLVELNRRAVEHSVVIVTAVAPEQLGRSTPSAAWDLSELLAHMTAQHRGFAASATGNADDLSVWAPALDEPDPVGAYERAADAVLAAFAEPTMLDAQVWLPEIATEASFPAELAIGFHLVDYVVHGWDVAAGIGMVPGGDGGRGSTEGLGAALGYDGDVLDAALAIALDVPGGAFREGSDVPFAPVLGPSGDGDPLVRTLELLGRDPHWAATA